MSAFSSCDSEREFEAGIWEGENEPVLETLMGIWTLLSQTCLWRRKDEDAYLEIHNAGDRNDYPRSIRDRYQYPPVAWQWWEGWGFTSWGDEQWMFATLEGSEGAPLVGEYEKNNHSHRLAKLSLWQHSGWSQTWIKIVPNHGQCTIIYIVECKKKKREREGKNPTISAKIIARKVFPDLLSGDGVKPEHVSRTRWSYIQETLNGVETAAYFTLF